LVSEAGIERLRRAAIASLTNNAELNAVTSLATQTATASLHVSLTRTYTTLANPTRFAITGGAPVANASSNRVYMQVSSVLPATSGNLSGNLLSGANDRQAWQALVGVRTDSAKVSFGVNGYASRPFRVIVDDGSGPKYINRTGAAVAADGSKTYIEVDFAGVYAVRDIWIEVERNTGVYDVSVVATSDVQPAIPRTSCVTLVTGDSYSESIGATAVAYGWAPTAGRLLGWSDVRQVAVGSCGYYADSSGTRSKLRDQIPRWLTVNSDLAASSVDAVVVACGLNDRTLVPGTYSATQVGAEAAACVQDVRARFPAAVIVVVGPWGAAFGPGSTIQAIEAAIQSAVTALNEANVLFLPCSTEVSPWTFGTGYIGATNGSGNSDRAIGSDGLHPSDAGHALIAARFASAYRRAIGI
jgi:lysophospholipase L1-like esterase